MYKLLKRNNRKGVFDQVQLAIIAMAAILIFVIFLYKAYANISEKMATQDCKNSITAHSLVAKGSFSEIFTDIKCPTREITIKKLNKANEIIAEDMHRCWYIWDQGKGQYFQGDGTFCHICSIYQFGDKGQEVEGLINYLYTQPIKTKYSSDTPGISYMDYFQGYKTPNSASLVENNQVQSAAEIDKLNTSMRYATIFVYASGKTAIQKALESGTRTTIGAAGIGGIIGGVAMTYGGVNAVAMGATVGLTASVGAEISAFLGGAAATTGAIAVTNFWNPIGWTAIAIGGVALIAGGIAVYTATQVNDPEWISYITFRPYNAEELKALGCEKMVVNQMSNVGTP